MIEAFLLFVTIRFLKKSYAWVNETQLTKMFEKINLLQSSWCLVFFKEHSSLPNVHVTDVNQLCVSLHSHHQIYSLPKWAFLFGRNLNRRSLCEKTMVQTQGLWSSTAHFCLQDEVPLSLCRCRKKEQQNTLLKYLTVTINGYFLDNMCKHGHL